MYNVQSLRKVTLRFPIPSSKKKYQTKNGQNFLFCPLCSLSNILLRWRNLSILIINTLWHNQWNLRKQTTPSETVWGDGRILWTNKLFNKSYTLSLLYRIIFHSGKNIILYIISFFNIKFINYLINLHIETSAKHVVIFAITQSQVSNSVTSGINP